MPAGLPYLILFFDLKSKNHMKVFWILTKMRSLKKDYTIEKDYTIIPVMVNLDPQVFGSIVYHLSPLLTCSFSNAFKNIIKGVC